MVTPRSFNPDHTTNWRRKHERTHREVSFPIAMVNFTEIRSWLSVRTFSGLGPLNLFIRDLKYERNQHANPQANSGIKTTIILNNIELE